jgi:pimeloyl-ACP methyl ester carboxylesterase
LFIPGDHASSIDPAMKTLRSDQPAANAPVSDHRIVLIPGFLGFNKIGDHAYFAETVGKALANALSSADPGRSIEVDAVETVPAGSLKSRQRKLVEELTKVRQKHPDAQLHLVGHSTGGLDAELFVRTPRAGHVRAAETDDIRRAVRSVITIASPLAGTSLALSPLARLSAIDSVSKFWRAPASLLLFRGPSAVAGVVGAALGLFGDSAANAIARNVFHRFAGGSFFTSLLLMRSLIDDLIPENVERIMKETQEDPLLPEIHRARFVTIARRNPGPTLAGQLFEFFYDSTKAEAQADRGTELVKQALKTSTPSVPIIGELPLPELEPGASDAIVNTLRQVPPCTASTVDAEVRLVSALVIADHIDVVGYFPGKDQRANGFLSSGSNFREAEFQKLYAAVASEVTRSMGKPTRPPPPLTSVQV